MEEVGTQFAIAIAQEVILKSLIEVGSLVKRQIALVRSFDDNVELLRGTLLPTAKKLMLKVRGPFQEAEFSEAEREKLLRGLWQFSSNAEAILKEFDTHVFHRQSKGKRISRSVKWKVARKIKALFAELEEISDLLRKTGVESQQRE